MTSTIRLILFLIVFPALVQAQSFVYEQEDQPVFAVDFPEDWFVDKDFLDEARAAGTVDNGRPEIRIIEAMPMDESKLWIGLWIVPRVSSLDEGLEYIASLDGELFTDVASTPPRHRELSGMPAIVFSGTGLRHAEPVEFAVALFEPSPRLIAIALYVGQPQTWSKHAAQLDAVRDSLRRVTN